MYQPRKSILQMFDPLVANSPSTPKREESNASPDNSDKENDAPRDPLSLSQYFNRTCHVKDSQQSSTPNGKLIDFGDVSIDEDDKLTPLGTSAVAMELQLDSGDVLLSAPLPMDLCEEGDTENAPPHPNGPFVTPQNRKILGDIDVDALQPPKPPTKHGALKISFLAAPNSESSPREIPTAGVTTSDPENDHGIPGPVITLYPPAFDSIPPTSSAPQISDKVDSYLSLQLPATMFTPRRSPLSSDHTSHRVSMDLQSTLQLQLQNGEYNFNLINDKISFLESSQEFIFPESDEDLDTSEIVEDLSVEDMLKSLSLQDKEVTATKRIPSSTPQDFAITSIPKNISELSYKSETPRVMSPVSLSSSSQDVPASRPINSVSSDVQNQAGSVLPLPLSARSSISGLKPVPTMSKPPTRVLVPPTKRLPSTTSSQRASLIRLPSRQSSTMSSLPKSVVATTKTIGKSTDGPRRVLVQPSDKPAPRSISTSTIPAPKTQGPQRVLVRAVSNNPVKKPLGPSSSINPPAPSSRLPGPSRIVVPSALKLTTKTSKSGGRWV